MTYPQTLIDHFEIQQLNHRYANAVDRAMPVLLNLANAGQSWRENGITHARVVGRIEAQIRNGCPALWEYIEARLEEERARGWFGIEA